MYISQGKQEETPDLVMLGLDHKSSNTSLRERLSFSTDEAESLLLELRNDMNASAVLLSTCNRTEIYIQRNKALEAQATRNELISYLSRSKSMESSLIHECTYFLQGAEVVRHLYRVTAGLESLIPGEGQILSQVKKSYLLSQALSCTNSLLNQLFQKALSCGKRVRHESQISSGAVSVPAAALQIVQSLSSPLNDKGIMILGSGEVARLCLDFLQGQKISADNIIVTKRAYSRMPEGYEHIQSTDYENFRDFLAKQDVILVCTGAPHYLLKASDLEGHPRKLAICDMSMPRNVEPVVGTLPQVKLINLDLLQAEVSKNLQKRHGEINLAQNIIQTEIDKFYSWCFYSQRAPVKVKSPAMEALFCKAQS